MYSLFTNLAAFLICILLLMIDTVFAALLFIAWTHLDENKTSNRIAQHMKALEVLDAEQRKIVQRLKNALNALDGQTTKHIADIRMAENETRRLRGAVDRVLGGIKHVFSEYGELLGGFDGSRPLKEKMNPVKSKPTRKSS